MLRDLLASLGRLERILDKFTKDKIIYTGVISIFTLSMLLYLVFIIPLGQKIEKSLEERLILQQEIERLGELQEEIAKMIPNNLELPEALNYLRTSFFENSLIVEEILINQLPLDSSRGFNQSAIKVTVIGERFKVMKAVTETQSNNKYPLLIQELDINNNRAVVDYKILFSKTDSSKKKLEPDKP